MKYFERKYSDECLIDTSTLSNDLKRYISIFKERNEKLKKITKFLKKPLLIKNACLKNLMMN